MSIKMRSILGDSISAGVVIPGFVHFQRFCSLPSAAYNQSFPEGTVLDSNCTVWFPIPIPAIAFERSHWKNPAYVQHCNALASE